MIDSCLRCNHSSKVLAVLGFLAIGFIPYSCAVNGGHLWLVLDIIGLIGLGCLYIRKKELDRIGNPSVYVSYYDESTRRSSFYEEEE